MRKRYLTVLGAVVAASAAMLAACSDAPRETAPAAPVNGGFESADLSGWSVEYGNAFDDDCVCSDKTFVINGDVNYNKIAVGQTGNWYLSGKGYHGKYSGARTGSIRSTEFVMPDDGYISLKLAGGSLKVGKGAGAVAKQEGKLCYVGLYDAQSDKMLARFTNEYFAEHAEDYVNPDKYANGSCHTDNFNEYSQTLPQYAGRKVYLRIVDNDESYYYGYIAVDDIRIGYDAQAQTEGEFFVKQTRYTEDIQAENEYEIKNGGFETGSLAGWTIVSGDAFSNDGVNAESVWWNENITYSRDGEYHYGMYRPEAVGVMRSSEFVLGGSGFISYKLGGCMDNAKTYLRFMVKGENGGGDEEVARFSNFKYVDQQFPFVQNGLRLLNMIQYYTDLSPYIGKTMYIEAVDENTSSDDKGCMTLDSVKTYWAQKPVWYDRESFVAQADLPEDEILPDSEYQIVNGGFETGDLTGWTLDTTSAVPMGAVTSDDKWWGLYSYNKRGSYLFSGINRPENGSSEETPYESGTGTLTSSPFEVAGTGYISYKFGGAKNGALCHIAIIDAQTNEVYKRFDNRYFADRGMNYVNSLTYLANMVLYKADLSDLMGKTVRIQIVDNATGDWGLVTADSFVTYYEKASDLPQKAKTAQVMSPALGEDDEYQVLNGDFETGSLYGWSLDGNIAGISSDNLWRGWGENILHNKDGKYFLSGWSGEEKQKGTLTSSAFTVGGAGWMTFKLGGGKNKDLCRVEIIDAQTNAVLAAYGNTMFRDNFKDLVPGTPSKPCDAAQFDTYLANMVLYKADLSAFAGRSVKIRIVDNATEDWGLLFADSFITHYETATDVAQDAILAENLIK